MRMTQEEKRIKEIKHLIYLKNELIKESKKEIKKLKEEKQMIEGYKVLERKYGKNSKQRNG